MRPRITVAAAALCVLGLAACAPEAAPAPRAVPTTIASSTAPPTTPTPTPTPTPALTPTAHRPTPPRPTNSPARTPTRTPTGRPPRPSAPPTQPPVDGPDNRLWVEGDSVLLGTTVTLPAALVGWRVTMDCVGSRRLPQAIPVLQANRSRLGSVVVIQMGNNYIAGEDGTFASQIDQAMRVLRGVRRVVWVTVAERWPSRVMINQAIRAAAGRWPTIRVADWAPIVAAHPEYAGDMLHLSPAGRIAISRLIANTVGPAPR